MPFLSLPIADGYNIIIIVILWNCGKKPDLACLSLIGITMSDCQSLSDELYTEFCDMYLKHRKYFHVISCNNFYRSY